MSFSIMRSKPEYPEEFFDHFPSEKKPWIFGEQQRLPEAALEYRLIKDYKEPLYPIYELPIPLIRNDLLEGLLEAGVDNIQTFDALIHHPELGEIQGKYLAFNILGIIATSSEAAEVMQHYVELEFETDEISGIQSDFSMIPDELLIARFADRMGRIIVSDRLKQHITIGTEDGLVFFDLEEATGAHT